MMSDREKLLNYEIEQLHLKNKKITEEFNAITDEVFKKHVCEKSNHTKCPIPEEFKGYLETLQSTRKHNSLKSFELKKELLEEWKKNDPLNSDIPEYEENLKKLGVLLAEKKG